MGFIAKNSGGGDFKKVPPGNHVARCYSIIDMGTQTMSGQFGEQSAHKIRLGFEVLGEDEDGTPMMVSINGKSMPMTIDKEYTVSMHEKANLRKELAAWRGRAFTAEEAAAFDVSKLLGQYCLLNVAHKDAANGKTYANIVGISPLPSALKNTKPAGVHPLVRFDLDAPDINVFESLSEWLQNKIKAAPEWDRKGKSSRDEEIIDDAEIDLEDCPF